MVWYIVVCTEGGALRYGNRNRLNKRRENAALYPSPSAAKIAIGRLMHMHDHILCMWYEPYNMELHPNKPAVIINRY